MQILFISDIFKHPVNHLPTNHDWLVDLWFDNSYNVTKIKNLFTNNDTEQYLPKKPYNSFLSKISVDKITQFLEEQLPRFNYIIAFECTYETRQILSSIHPNIIFIYFSPLRYCNRQTFTLSSNNSNLQQRIDFVYQKSKHYYHQQAYFVKNLISNQTENLNINSNSILLIGQVENDLSVWNGNTFLCLDDYYDDIMKLTANYSTVYYKPHPFSNNNNDRILNSKNIIKTDDEIYRLLSCDAIKHIVTVSSSVASEAKMFGKTVTQFSHLYISKDCKNIPHTLDYQFWQYMFDADANDEYLKLEIDQIDIRPIRKTYWGYKYILDLTSPYAATINSLQNELEQIKKTKLFKKFKQ